MLGDNYILSSISALHVYLFCMHVGMRYVLAAVSLSLLGDSIFGDSPSAHITHHLPWHAHTYTHLRLNSMRPLP